MFAVASAGQSYLSVRHLLHNSEVYRAYFWFCPLIKCYRRTLSSWLCSTSAERNQISPNNPQKSWICNIFSISPYETYIPRKASGFYPITNYRGESESEKPNDLFQIRGKALLSTGTAVQALLEPQTCIQVNCHSIPTSIQRIHIFCSWTKLFIWTHKIKDLL